MVFRPTPESLRSGLQRSGMRRDWNSNRQKIRGFEAEETVQGLPDASGRGSVRDLTPARSSTRITAPKSAGYRPGPKKIGIVTILTLSFAFLRERRTGYAEIVRIKSQ